MSAIMSSVFCKNLVFLLDHSAKYVIIYSRKENNMDQSINKRFRDLRLSLNLTLRQIEKDTGISNSHYSLMETGKQAVSEKFIKLLSKTYNVNEAWLLTGSGEMLLSENKTSKYCDNKELELLNLFQSLTKDQQDIVLKFCQFLSSQDVYSKNQ